MTYMGQDTHALVLKMKDPLSPEACCSTSFSNDFFYVLRKEWSEVTSGDGGVPTTKYFYPEFTAADVKSVETLMVQKMQDCGGAIRAKPCTTYTASANPTPNQVSSCIACATAGLWPIACGGDMNVIGEACGQPKINGQVDPGFLSLATAAPAPAPTTVLGDQIPIAIGVIGSLLALVLAYGIFAWKRTKEWEALARAAHGTDMVEHTPSGDAIGLNDDDDDSGWVRGDTSKRSAGKGVNTVDTTDFMEEENEGEGNEDGEENPMHVV